MNRVLRRRGRGAGLAAAWVVLALVATAVVAIHGQDNQVALYVFAADDKGVPVLDLKPADMFIKEEAGDDTVVSVRRVGWPLKVTVLVDNGPRTTDALVHLRSGLKKFFAGLPAEVPVSLIATAPNPRWLFRETKDKVRIDRGPNLLTPDEGLGRFSDSLIEYSRRLDEEFRDVTSEQLPPYLPVLVSIATTHQDGSNVVREQNLKMIMSLRQHRVWTHMIMISGTRALTDPGGLPNVEFDEGQNAEVAKAVQEVTRGTYTPVTQSGTSALASKILPDLAQVITLRYIRQMMMHRVVFERPSGATGPMKNFSLALVNKPGVKVVVSRDGNMP